MSQSFTRSAISLSWCKACKLYLAFSFAMGFTLGVLLACTTAPNSFLLMRSVVMRPVSIVGAFVVWLLPFLITAFAVFKLPARCIPAIAFFKALSYGFVLQLIYIAFPGAGWLVRSLLLFTDNISILLLYCLWLRNIPRKSPAMCKDFGVCACILTAATVLDYCLLSPFMVMLINN